MQKKRTISEQLLAIKIGKPIIFYLLNGKEVKGILRGFEQYSITIENEKGNIETYYKHILGKICFGNAQKLSKVFEKKEEIKEKAN